MKLSKTGFIKIHASINPTKFPEIVARLEEVEVVGNISKYIRELIRRDIESRNSVKVL